MIQVSAAVTIVQREGRQDLSLDLLAPVGGGADVTLTAVGHTGSIATESYPCLTG